MTIHSLSNLCKTAFINDKYIPNPKWQEKADEVIKNQWKKLVFDAKSANNTFLVETISQVEESVVQDGKQLEENPLPNEATDEQTRSFLGDNAINLFKLLNKKLKIHATATVECSDYLQILHARDAALRKLWDTISCCFEFSNDKPNTLDEIKAWLKDPSNQDQLEIVITLDLKSEAISEIPLEIKYFSKLQTLILSNNKIRDTRPLCKLVHLKILKLDNNLIRDVKPLGKLLRLEELHLENNQICDIAIFSNLTRLYYLSLK